MVSGSVVKSGPIALLSLWVAVIVSTLTGKKQMPMKQFVMSNSLLGFYEILSVPIWMKFMDPLQLLGQL